jgi:hypothetical protein
LLNYYSITIDSRYDSYIRSDTKSLHQEMALIKKSVAGRELSHESSLEHDAYHRLLILALRQGYEEKSPLEVPFWFLTCDLKLPVYDLYARKHFGGNKVPFCVLSSQWMQLLAPFSEAINKQSDSNNGTLNHPIFRAFQMPPPSLIQELITRLAVASKMPLSAYVQVILSTAFIHAFDEEVNSVFEIFQLEESNVSTPPKNEVVLEKLRVFLCHSSKDKPVIRQLYLKLRSEKWLDPWLDEEKLLPGVDWELEIKLAIKSSHAVIVFLTKHSISKEGFIQKEIGQALSVAEEKPEGTLFVIPVRLEECDVPNKLQRWQWLNFYEENSYNKLLNSLLKRAESLSLNLE